MVEDMTSKLKKINLYDKWKINLSDIHNDIIHLYYEGEYYTTVDEFFKCEIDIHDMLKRFNRDIKIKKIIE